MKRVTIGGRVVEVQGALLELLADVFDDHGFQDLSNDVQRRVAEALEDGQGDDNDRAAW